MAKENYELCLRVLERAFENVTSNALGGVDLETILTNKIPSMKKLRIGRFARPLELTAASVAGKPDPESQK